MMNDETEPFEQRLRCQPVKEIPCSWRAEILGAAKSYRPAVVAHRSLLSTINSQLSTVFWPHPKAWAGLAAIWILIFAVNFSTRDKTPMVAEKSMPPSPEVIAQLRQQRLLFAQLMGSTETDDADRPKSFLPRPRAERSFEMLTA